MKMGSEKLSLGDIIKKLQYLEANTMPSELPVEIFFKNGQLVEIEKIEFFRGSLGLFAAE